MMQSSVKRAARSWLLGALFVWALLGAVAWATFSSRERVPAPLVAVSDSPQSRALDAAPPAEDVAAAAEIANRAKNGQSIAWENSFENAMQRARREKKPILIDFYTDWCSVCKQMDREVYPKNSVIHESRNWVSIKINAEKRPDVAGAYGVTGYPTIVFASGTGQPVAVLPGYDPSMDFAALMRQAHAKWRERA